LRICTSRFGKLTLEIERIRERLEEIVHALYLPSQEGWILFGEGLVE